MWNFRIANAREIAAVYAIHAHGALAARTEFRARRILPVVPRFLDRL